MIVILGGGVAGAALAWALVRRRHRRVVVFDLLPPGSGSTARALGGFRTQHGSALNITLSLASRSFFAERADRLGFRAVGYLYLAETDTAAAELGARADFQRAQGLPIDHPDPSSLVPFAALEDVVAVNFCALDGVYQPVAVLRCLVEEAREAGAEFRYGAEAKPAELAAAEAVVICAGMWSRRVGAELGVSLDVTPLERGIFQVGPFDWLRPETPLTLDAGSGYHFRERDGRLLVIGPGDPYDWSHHRSWLARRVPQAAIDRPEAHWTGFYEMTFDHHPLAGPTESERVWAMCGFSGHGVMHAPAVGDSLAAMLLGESPPIDLSPLSPRRQAPLVDATQL